MKKKRTALLTSILALLLCVSMLVGTTFAWFTDSVSSGSNVIAAGVLDVELEQLVDGKWIPVNESTNVFDEDALWEPGYTQVVYLRVRNAGDLALKYQLGVNIASETGSVNVKGNPFVLSDYIEYGTVQGVQTPFASREAARAAVTESSILSVGYTQQETLLPGAEPDYLALVVFMPETVENDANYATGAPAPQINLGVKLFATQEVHESDSFGSGYDAPASMGAFGIINESATTQVAANDEGMLPESVNLSGSEVIAEVPAGVKLAEGATELTLTVTTMDETLADVTTNNRSEVVRSVDVHIEGVAEDNTVPMVIAINGLFPVGLNPNNVKLFHVEDDQTVEMTMVDAPANHNEFSYDPLTGNAVIAIASFSEITVWADTTNKWDGAVANGFHQGTGTKEDPYVIANAAQFVYFRNEVDGGRTFEGEYVQLTTSINLNNVNFDPIGYGYEYDGFTEDGATFNGTFDGNNHTIYGLYQNGWEANDCDKTYSYGMAGGGLFASVCDATIKNLNISGADIVMECIDMGVVAGYAQGNCTFENIGIMNCTIQNYNRYTGGVVGECSPRYDVDGNPLYSNHVFNKVRVDSATTVSSLWGSFDTSLGGILGGKWDKNGAETKVTMTDCHVACTIDAFNDVTSAYQWYAYRRAGMLIGNTEQSANNKALAEFLTCENVYVYYGKWNDYHYCEFTNQSGTEDTEWQNNYPWVRIEEGLSCNAYSNPRYGHPIVNGTAIVDSIHSHAGDDECMVSIPFRQLYGGGQGVYGATEHTGVSEGAYTVTYINYGEYLKVEFVADNSQVHTLWKHTEFTYGGSTPTGWVDGNGKTVTSVLAGNTQHITVYPKWQNEFTIRFYDAENNLLYYETFKRGQSHTLNMDNVNAALTSLQNKVDASGKVIQVSWNEDLTKINFANKTADITVKAVYNLSNSSITLREIKNDNGDIVAYEVVDAAKTSENVNIYIPPYVGTLPIINIAANAFAGFDNLHVVTIPTTVTSLGANALASDWNNGFLSTDKGESMTIYYKGSYQEWVKMTLADGWSDGVSASTRIFFLNGTDTVDKNQGYLQFVVDDSTLLGAVKKGHFEYMATVPDSFVNEYYKDCDCKVTGCTGNLRPDAHYWEAYVN